MTRHELVEALAVERHAPGPRPPRFRAPKAEVHVDPVSAEEAEENRRRLLDVLDGTDARVVALRRPA